MKADVADAGMLASGVADAARDLGPVTALLHAAGVNEPLRFADIDDATLERVMTPKTAGLRAAVAAAGPLLHRIVVFGSILGRIGLQGEAHYALANAFQTMIGERLAHENRRFSLLCLEWSIWNGAGMGHQLGSIERLARQGVDAISLDEGIAAFERLVQGGAEGSFIVTGRFGSPRYVSLGASELPLYRFVDRPLLHYPGLELVIETTLSIGRDPYLEDHRIDGSAILPAVIGLEAMAQVACALIRHSAPSVIEAVTFRKAIAVPDQGAIRVRILALADEDGNVECAIHTEEDGFALDHMRAVFRFGPIAALSKSEPSPRACEQSNARVDAAPLYGPLMFQGRRFQHIAAFTRISARHVAAALHPPAERFWFAPLEPQQRVLADPAARDALLHALQVAVPHLRVVPMAVERITLRPGGAPVTMQAVETRACNDTFVFDIKAYDDAGDLVEYWQGATFRAIAEIPVDPVIAVAPEAAAPYLERVARASTDVGSIEVALVTGDQIDRRRASALAALDLDGGVHARLDGKPIVVGAGETPHLSISHCSAFTLAVKANRAIACDIEPISPQSAATPPAAETPWSAAAERLWTRDEVALKQDLRPDLAYTTRLQLGRDVVVFENAFGRIATIRVNGLGDHVMVAIGTAQTAAAERGGQP